MKPQQKQKRRGIRFFQMTDSSKAQIPMTELGLEIAIQAAVQKAGGVR